MKTIRNIVLTVVLSFSFGFVAIGQVVAGSMQFSPTSLSPNQGELFEVSVIVNTNNQEIGGAGARIKYDPKSVIVDSVIVGDIFADYPQVKHDNMKGELVISGISANSSSLYSGEGVLATIRWQAVAAGKSKVTFDFTPGSTTDSNMAVTFGNGDILSQVNELSLNVNAVNQSGQSVGGFFSRITSFFNTSKSDDSAASSNQVTTNTGSNQVQGQPNNSAVVDQQSVVNETPSAPEESLTPQTDVTQQESQPETVSASEQISSAEAPALPQWVWFIAGGLATIVVVTFVYYFRLKRQLKTL